MRFVKFLIRLSVLVLFAGAVSAQGTKPDSSSSLPSASNLALGNIHGKIVFPNNTSVDNAVKISLLNYRGSLAVIYTDNEGQFDIPNLTPGEYTLRVEADRLRYEVINEQVQVYRGMPSNVTIALKEKSSSNEARPRGDVISVNELDKDVPPQARKEFDRAGKLAQEGKAAEAIEHLRKVLSLYPNFMAAHNDLGAQLLEQGNLDEAATELRRAIELDAKAFNPYLNLGIILVRQQRFSEAAETLRKALSLESNSPAAKLYLGLALTGLNDLDGAERELKASYNLGGAAFAVALFHLGEIYMNKGERLNAQRAFEAYLHDAPKAVNSAQARKLIRMLQ